MRLLLLLVTGSNGCVLNELDSSPVKLYCYLYQNQFLTTNFAGQIQKPESSLHSHWSIGVM